MFVIPLSDLIEMMLATGQPTQLLAAAEWPLHKALRELKDEAESLPSPVLAEGLRFRPDPDCGYRAEGAGSALWELRSRGVLLAVGTGLDAGWVGNDEMFAKARRLLFSLEPREADAVYRAGVRWASLASTALKNWATPATSSASTVAGVTKALHLSIPALR